MSDRHDFSQTIHGKDADEIETRAREAVLAYFGSLSGVAWAVDTDAQVNLAGQVLGYIGKVSAERV